MDNIQIEKFTGLNSFAENDVFLPPAFETYICQYKSISAEKVDIYKNLILENYEDIFSKHNHKVPDQGKGFLLNLYNFYNVFEDLKCDKTESLRVDITNILEACLQKMKVTMKLANHDSWFNVLKFGERAPRHCHIIDAEKSLSWVLFLSDSKTSLNIEFPHMYTRDGEKTHKTYMKYSCEAGKVVIFPSWLHHFTDSHREKQDRYSIAGKVSLL